MFIRCLFTTDVFQIFKRHLGDVHVQSGKANRHGLKATKLHFEFNRILNASQRAGH